MPPRAVRQNCHSRSFTRSSSPSGCAANALSTAIPELSYTETASGIQQVATRAKNNVRISDWTFPNNNHIVQPGPNKGDPWSHTYVWAVPIDDFHTARFTVYAFDASAACRCASLIA